MILDSHFFAAGEGSQLKQLDNHTWYDQQLQSLARQEQEEEKMA